MPGRRGVEKISFSVTPMALQWVLYDGIYQAIFSDIKPPTFNVSHFYPLPYYDTNDIPVPKFD